MVSPELLRRYPFFGFLDTTQLKAMAMIAEEVEPQTGEDLFKTDQPAAALYLLVGGNIELWYIVADKLDKDLRKEFYICDINPGEILGISAVIEPYQYVSTARVTSPSRLIKIEAAALRALCEIDCQLGYGLMRQTAKAAMDRLHDTRIQLVAARA